MNIRVYIPLVLVLSIIFLLVACTSGGKTKLKKEAAQYLKEKYGKEFIVNKIRHSFDNQMYYMSAYPTDNPELQFSVTKRKHETSFSDTYIYTLYEQESEEELFSVVKGIYPDVWDYESEILFGEKVEEKLLQKGIPSYEEARELYPEGIRLNLKVYLIKDLNKRNKQDEVKNIWRLVQFYQDTGLQKVSLSVVYYDESLREKDEGIPDKQKRNEYHRDYFRYLFETRDLNQIKKIEDVEKYLIKSGAAP